MTRALDEREMAALREAIARDGVRVTARAIGIAPDALSGTASGGHARAGTNLACRVWLAKGTARASVA